MIGRITNRTVGLICLPVLPLLALVTLWLFRRSHWRLEHSYCYHLRSITNVCLSMIATGGVR